MAVPKYDEFFPSVLIALKDGQVHSMKEVRAVCATVLGLSDADQTEAMPTGKTYFADRVGWAKTYLKKAGLVENASYGKVRLTEEGMRVANKEPEKVTLEYLEQYHSFLDFFRKDANPGTGDNSSVGQTESREVAPDLVSPQEQIARAVEEMNRELVGDLMEVVYHMDPYDFEKLVVKLLITMGYGTLRDNMNAVTKKSGDEGIDGVIAADKFGFDSVYIQAKRWQESSMVGAPEIQKFCGAMLGQGATKGLFITTAKFTANAINYANKALQSKIVLVDGVRLAELMIEYNIGVSTVETYQIKKVDTDFFNDFE